jgi:hypothetical protein
MKLGLILSATDKFSRVVDTAMSKSAKSIKNFNKITESVNSVSNKLLLGGGGIVAGLWKSIEAAEEGEASQRRLTNAFRQMWGNSPKAIAFAKAQGEIAEKTARQIGVDEDVIRLTQAKLATFTNISNKTAVMAGIFDRATIAAQDMAAMGFGEASENAVLLGKALQDPLRMATALKRQGTLTALDILKVKDIYTTQGLLEAQKFILAKVEKQVKGTAAATATATSKMKVGFAQVTEEIGRQFLPYLDKYQSQIPKLVEKTLSWISSNKNTIITISKLAVGAIALAGAIRVITFTAKTFIAIQKAFAIATVLVNNSMIFSKLQYYAVAAAQKVLIITTELAKKSMILFRLQYYALTAAQKVSAAWTAITTSSVWAFTAALLANPITWVVVGIMALVAGLVLAWKKFEGFRAVIKTTWEVIKGFGTILKEFVLDRIKGIISGIGSIGKAIGLLFKGKFKEAGAEAFKGVKDLTGITALKNAVKHTVTLGKSVPQTYSKLYAQEHAIQLKKDSEKQPVSETETMYSKQTVNNQNAVSNLTKHVDSKSITYAPVINLTGGTAVNKDDFMKLLNDNRVQFELFIKKLQNNQSRLSYQ